jgi:hypothetical protein
MKRTFLVAVCLMLLPIAAAAQPNVLSADLTGDGQGFVSLAIDGTTIQYSILVSGFAPSSAFIGEGTPGSGTELIDLGASFTNGAASGSVEGDQSDIDAILANPSGYYVQVDGDGSSATGALSSGGSMQTELYFPVAASVAGQADTNFKTDARMINRSGDSATVTLEYYPRGDAGNSGPAEVETVTIGANQQGVLDDFVTELFGVTNGRGGVRITADRTVSASARIYNDQVDAGLGTFGQYVVGLPMSMAYTWGNLPFLSNTPSASGEGYRANIGWFNPNSDAVTVTFNAWDAASGAQIGTVTNTINGLAHDQFNVSDNQLFGSSFNDVDDFYVTYYVEGNHSLFIYASVVDNVNGDAVYIPASR